jgi:hypothetical protein
MTKHLRSLRNFTLPCPRPSRLTPRSTLCRDPSSNHEYSRLAVWLLIAVIWAAPAHGASICLHVQARDRLALYAVPAGTGFAISFRHSIYGTEVQEQFRITPTGFQTDKLRYAEVRLAEFYGHDAAKFEQGWWTVNNSGNELRQLNVRVSKESAVEISLGERRIWLAENQRIGDHVRLSITSCGDASRGR